MQDDAGAGGGGVSPLKERRAQLLAEGAARLAALEAEKSGGASPAGAPAPAPSAPAEPAAAQATATAVAERPAEAGAEAEAPVPAAAAAPAPAVTTEAAPKQRSKLRLALMALAVLGLLGAGMVVLLLFVATMFFAVPVELAGVIYVASFAVILVGGIIAFFLGR